MGKWLVHKLYLLNSMKHPVEWTSNFNNLESLKLVDIFSEFALHCDLVFHNTPCILRLELCCTASERTYILHTVKLQVGVRLC